MNVELLRKVKKHILEEPQRLYMGDWIARGKPGERVSYFEGSGKFANCGTAACIGGWAGLLSSKNGELEGPSFRELLGLTYEEANRLFYLTAWPEQFRLTFKDDGSEASARMTADRIEHFIATEGRE